MCGCENCRYHKVWYSNDYWSPDEHECIIPDSRIKNPDFDFSDDEIDDIIERVWTNGETWDSSSEQICPYYERYIEKY